MKIRKGTPEDVAAVSSLYNELNAYLEANTNYPGWKKGIYPAEEDACQATAENTLFVAESGGRIIGTVILNHKPEQGYEQADWKNDLNYSEILVVHTFAVHPAFLRKGIGRNMIRWISDYAAGTGMKAVRLDVYEKNIPAIHVYEAAGFEYIATEDLGYGKYGLGDFRLYQKVL